MKTQIALSLLTALSASVCCVTPVLAIMAGTSSLATSFHWIEPFRPYFISASVLVLGFAWFSIVQCKKRDNCDCAPEEKEIVLLFTNLSMASHYHFGSVYRFSILFKILIPKSNESTCARPKQE